MVFSDIAEQERCITPQLPARRDGHRPRPELLRALAAWSESVWAEAKRAGPLLLSEEVVARGLSISARPVFICGAHRSGTTLTRNLLDGHPALIVLPSDASFFRSFLPKLAGLTTDAALALMGREWLRRLANPHNQPPYWLLGQSTEADSPYVDFARALLAFWPEMERRLDARISMRPLVTVALAWGYCTRAFDAGRALQYWVEKTPTNERYLAELWAQFPDARVIHVVRHPAAIFASRKRAELQARGSFPKARAALRDMAASYSIALRHGQQQTPGYHLIRYEDLVRDPASAVGALAEFLDIEPLPDLRTSIAGWPAGSNSSFGTADAPGLIQAAPDAMRETLSKSEQQRIAAWTADPAGRLGYDVAAIGEWKARWLRLVAGRW
jgi:hypothetical protein